MQSEKAMMLKDRTQVVDDDGEAKFFEGAWKLEC
jgi:hypothetical protein